MPGVKMMLQVYKGGSSDVYLVFLRLAHRVGLRCSASTSRNSLGGIAVRSGYLMSFCWLFLFELIHSHDWSLVLVVFRFDALGSTQVLSIYVVSTRNWNDFGHGIQIGRLGYLGA
jgi:hypothetical protein